MIMPLSNAGKLPVQSGCARLRVESVAGASAVTSASATNPMKLLTPRARGQSVWAYTSSFGGGLVAGDQTRLDLHLTKTTRCFLGTQASTKIYRSGGLAACTHVTEADLESESLLVYAPDPVQAYAESHYSQRQTFRLEDKASLVLLDWFTSGRQARGERWEFSCFQSRNEVLVDGRRVLLDSLRLDAADEPVALPHRTGRYNCLATLLLLGPLLDGFAQGLLKEVAGRSVTRQASLICAASPVRQGALLRLAGTGVEMVGRELQSYLQPLSTLLGDDPWSRKW